MNYSILFILLLLSFFNAQAQPVGDEYLFVSPNQLTEKCIAVQKFPGREDNYSKSDVEDEKFFCGLNFYDEQIAICPKTWSTSPGTMVYDSSLRAVKQKEYETTFCKGRDHKTLAKYKQTMNQQGTSGTFSIASLLYYHFSRYFKTDVHVPVSVYRSIDRQVHYERVIKNGLKLSPAGMIKEGWKHLEAGAIDPNSYKPKSELYTDEDRQTFGILLDDKGERYGVEINGTRESGWGAGQNYDFQKTIPFLALKVEQDLIKSIDKAKTESSSKVKSATGDVSNAQVIFWMKELTEIAILDHIFSQQDRVGNIDYRWYWYWVDEKGQGKKRVVSEDHLKKLPRSKMSLIQKEIPQDLINYKPVLLQRTQLNDNDAGGRAYANFTKITKMVESLRHISPNTYQRLVDLHKDFEAQGELYKYVQSSFGLSAGQFNQLVKNANEVMTALRILCESKKLRFDLDPKGYLTTGKIQEHEVVCF